MASSYRSFRDLDWPLLVITLAICAAGVLQIYSATHDTIWHDAWWKQIVWVAGGCSADVDLHRRRLPHADGPGLVMLRPGDRRTAGRVPDRGAGIRLPALDSAAGGFKFQISEFAKFVIVLLVARYLSELNKDELDWRSMLKLAGFIGVPMVLVMKQPDLGTALTYLPILVVGVFLAGMRWKYVAVILGVLAHYAARSAGCFSKDYQKRAA